MTHREVVALCPVPLDARQRDHLTGRLGQVPRQVLISDLRGDGLLGTLRRIRSLRPGLLILVCPDESLRSLVPVMQVLALAAPARRQEVMWPDLTHQPVGWLAAWAGAWRIAVAFWQGWRAVGRCRRDLDRLARLPRAPLRRTAGQAVLYLKVAPPGSQAVGGSAAHTAGVVGALLAAGYAVDYGSTEPPPAAVADRVAFHRVAAAATEVPPLRLARSAVELNLYRLHRAMASRYSKVADSSRHAFVYQRYSLANYAGVVVSRRAGIPLVLEYNGSEVWVAAHWAAGLAFGALARAAEEACLRHAQVIVTISEVLRDDLLARGVEAERIVTHPNGVDADLFDPARFDAAARAALRRRWDIAADAVVVTFIGTFGQWHGVEVLAAAIRLLAETEAEWLRRNKVMFMLVGDGLRRAEVERILDHPVCREVARLTGSVPQDQAPAVLAAADIFASPHVGNADGTRFFGSPTKLFEYLAMARPVVASRLDQIGDVLAACPRAGGSPDLSGTAAAGQAGLLTTPGDAAELARAIRLLVDHPAWRRAAGLRARDLVLDRYTWRHNVAAVLDRLHTLGGA